MLARWGLVKLQYERGTSLFHYRTMKDSERLLGKFPELERTSMTNRSSFEHIKNRLYRPIHLAICPVPKPFHKLITREASCVISIP
jgi:hypothetical protein